MIIKNGGKEYLFMGLGFGLGMGIYFFLSTGLFIVALVSAIFAGAMFGGLMALVTKHPEKAFKQIREEVLSQNQAICEGVVTFGFSNGWLFLFEDSLLLYRKKAKDGNLKTVIDLKTVKNFATEQNAVVLFTEEKAHKFMVAKPLVWAQFITTQLNKINGINEQVIPQANTVDDSIDEF